MKKYIFTLLLISGYLCSSISQVISNASNNWYFGDRAGLNFNTNPPTVLTDGLLNTQEGVATISDKNGQLLFYTDGITVWDQTHQPMPNGNGNLAGHFSSTQSSIIIPNIADSTIYYIFTVDELAQSNGLSYTTVDISLAGNGNNSAPLGDVINSELNIQLTTPVTEKITGVLKPDCTGYWVIAHGWNNNRFYCYEVSASGVNTNPIISDVGNIHSGGSGNINAVGYMKISPNGEKLALINRNNVTVDLYDFDIITGTVSNEIEINPIDPLLYGIEFSPNSAFLYIGGKDIISQYNLSTGNLFNIEIDMPGQIGNNDAIRALQLGPDNNIYVSIRNHEFISAIYNPNSIDPELIVNAIFLDPDGTGRNCIFGLPNIFYIDFNSVVIDSLTMMTCPGEQIEFNGTLYNEGSINELTFTNLDGCDSILILTVEAFETNSDLLLVEACEGSFYNYNGIDILAGTQQSFIFPDINGCDSVFTVVVEISTLATDSLTLMTCPGEQAEFNGMFYDIGSINEISFTGNNGCDSMVILSVDAFLVEHDSLNVMACEGSFYNYNGTNIPAGTQQIFSFTDSNGCDSMVNVIVEATAIVEIDSLVQACEGGHYIFEGVEVPAGSTEQFSITVNDSCIVLINLFVEPLALDSTSLIISNCSDTTFSFMGQEIVIGAEASFTLQNQFGCDSILTISVTENIQESFLEVMVCPGETYDFNGSSYPAGTDTTFVFMDQAGCDSIIYLSVLPNPPVSFNTLTESSCWNGADGMITFQNVTGGLNPLEYSIDGENYSLRDTFENLPPGAYSVFIRDSVQCVYSQEVEVEEITEIQIASTPVIFPCDADSVLLQVDLINGNASSLVWEWSNGDSSIFTYVQTAGTYSLSLSNECQTIEENIPVELEAGVKENLIYIPNVFTPNDDGYNDQFQLFPAQGIEVIDFEIRIFDRWGALLFRSTDINRSWDGFFKNKKLDNGVYVYWMKARIISCQRNMELFEEGGITIVR